MKTVGRSTAHDSDLGAPVLDELVRPCLCAEELAQNPDGFLTVLRRVHPEVEIDHGYARGCRLFDEARLLDCFFGFEIERQHIGLQRDCRLQAEITTRDVTETRQLFDLRKALEVTRIRVRILLDQVVAPADDRIED